MRKYCRTHPFRRSYLQPAFYHDGGFFAFLLEGPNVVVTLEIDHRLGPQEVARDRRCASTVEIGWRANHHPVAPSDSSRGQGGVRQSAHSESNIDAMLDEVDIAIVENDFEVELCVLLQETRQSWNEVNSGERDGGANA